jgi:hypothetical protein
MASDPLVAVELSEGGDPDERPENPPPNCIICWRFSSKPGFRPYPVDDQGALNRPDKTPDFPG